MWMAFDGTLISARAHLLADVLKVVGMGSSLLPRSEHLKTLGGTPNKDPCSLCGLIWGLPRDIGVV